MMHEFFERLEVFSLIQADPKYKSFTYDKIPMVGVTKVCQACTPPFDKVGQATKKAAKLTAEGTPTTPEQLIAEWDLSGKISTELGCALHSYIEASLANKFSRYPADEIKKAFQGEDPVFQRYTKVCSQFDAMREKFRGKMIPVASELVVGDPSTMICGIIDQLFWNKTANEFQIWDWKTNKELKMSSQFMLNDPLGHVSTSDVDKFSLQVSFYKKIFTKMTGIPVGNCYICWFSSEREAGQIIPVKDMSREVEILEQLSMKQRGIVDQNSVF